MRSATDRHRSIANVQTAIPQSRSVKQVRAAFQAAAKRRLRIGRMIVLTVSLLVLYAVWR
jgi:hypothetical protein